MKNVRQSFLWKLYIWEWEKFATSKLQGLLDGEQFNFPKRFGDKGKFCERLWLNSNCPKQNMEEV